MNILTTSVPEWVSVSFLVAIVVSAFMVAKMAKEGAVNANFSPENTISSYRSVLVFYFLYFIGVSLASFTGVFSENTLPPRILVFTTIPLLAFFLLVVSNLNWYKMILKNIPLQALVYVHSFRFIGFFFLISTYYGAIPAKFAYIAGIGDITIATTCIFVGRAIAKGKKYARLVTMIWNTLGIMDIVSVVVTAILTTKLSLTTGSQGLAEMGRFPFCLIPAFAPATILFLHLSVFRKLYAQNHQKSSIRAPRSMA